MILSASNLISISQSGHVLYQTSKEYDKERMWLIFFILFKRLNYDSKMIIWDKDIFNQSKFQSNKNFEMGIFNAINYFKNKKQTREKQANDGNYSLIQISD